LFEQENFETLIDTFHNLLKNNMEKVDKNITLIPNKNGKTLKLIRLIEQN
jgi:hypothetical protein